MRRHPGIWLIASLVTVALGLGVFSILHYSHEDEFASCHFCLLVSHGAPLPLGDIEAADGEPSTPVSLRDDGEPAVIQCARVRTRGPPCSLPS